MRFIYASFSTLMLFCLFFFSYIFEDSFSMQGIGIAALIVYSYLFVSSWHLARHINFYIIFLFSTLVFFWGQHIILLCNVDFTEPNRSILSGRVADWAMMFAGVFILQSMLTMHIGYCLFFKKYRNTKYIEIYDEKTSNTDVLLKIALGIMAISIIPAFSLALENLGTASIHGYGMIFQTENYQLTSFSNIKRFISLFFIPSTYLIYILASKKLRIVILLILMAYSLVLLTTGSRIIVFMIAFALFMIHYKKFQKLRARTIILLGTVAFFLMLSLSVVSSVRNVLYTSDNIGEIVVLATEKSFDNFIVFSVFEELGFTYNVIACVIENCPVPVPYNYGLSYLLGLTAIFPNVFGGTHIAAQNTDMLFAEFYTTQGGIGSSFIAEAYYNFGRWGLLVMLVFGMLLAKLCFWLEKSANEKLFRVFFLCVYSSSLILFYTRSDTATFPRNFVYYGLFPLFLEFLIRTSKKSVYTTICDVDYKLNDYEEK